jgi:IMP dehydrogenase
MQKGSSDRYFQADSADEKLVPEGVEGRVPFKGPLTNTIYQLLGGVRSSMGYVGCATIEEMRTRPEFVQVSNAGMRESHVHDVDVKAACFNLSSPRKPVISMRRTAAQAGILDRS